MPREGHKGREKVLSWKTKTVEDVVSKLKNSQIIGLFERKGLPTDYLKKVRFNSKEDLELIKSLANPSPSDAQAADNKPEYDEETQAELDAMKALIS